MRYWEKLARQKLFTTEDTEATEKELACSHAPAWEQDIQAKNKKAFLCALSASVVNRFCLSSHPTPIKIQNFSRSRKQVCLIHLQH